MEILGQRKNGFFFSEFSDTNVYTVHKHLKHGLWAPGRHCDFFTYLLTDFFLIQAITIQP